MLCQTSKVLLGKLKSYETMQFLVFLPLVAKFLMKWRFLLEPIGEFPSVVRTPKIWRSFEALKDIAWKKSNLSKKKKKKKYIFYFLIPLRYVEFTFFFHWLFFNTILRYLLEMSFQTHPPRLGWSSKVLGLPDWAWWRHNHLNFGAFFRNIGCLQRLTTLEKNVVWQNKQSNVQNGQKMVFFTHSMQF